MPGTTISPKAVEATPLTPQLVPSHVSSKLSAKLSPLSARNHAFQGGERRKGRDSRENRRTAEPSDEQREDVPRDRDVVHAAAKEDKHMPDRV